MLKGPARVDRSVARRPHLAALLVSGCAGAMFIGACGGGDTDQVSASGGTAGGTGSGSGGTAGAGVSGQGGSGGATGSGGTSAGASGTASGGASAGNAGSGAGGGGAGSAGASGSGPGEPTSCATPGPGRTDCGKNGDESCCASSTVESGTYFRTYVNSGSGATGTADPATITAYRLDKYEVTVGRFREYVKYLENGGAPPAGGSGKHTHLNGGQGLADSGDPGSFEPGWDETWNSKIPNGPGATAEWKALLTEMNTGDGGCDIYGTWTDEPGDNELRAITCTSWFESYAFCIWDGGFLPSEAEWKYAAAGGDEQRRYPWGSTDPGSENEYSIYDCCYPDGECRGAAGVETCTGPVNVAPPGFAELGVGRYGQFDLIGNVWEWLLDRYSDDYVNPCEDCAYLTGNTENRVMPGAGFHTNASLGATLMYSYNRTSVSYAGTFRGDYAVGLRCARSP